MEEKTKSFLAILGLIIAIISIWFATPINLDVEHEILEDGGRIQIYVKNMDFIRSTGTINLFRLEINPHKPHIQLKEDHILKPREKKLLFDIPININKASVDLSDYDVGEEVLLPDGIKALLVEVDKISVPEWVFYQLTENTSISYKVTCDVCSGQGIIRREPKFQELYVERANIKNLPSGHTYIVEIPVYSWPTV